MSLKVKLFTSTGDFVTEVIIPKFERMPEAILWGQRTFVLTDVDGRYEYREGMGYVAFTPKEMADQGRPIYEGQYKDWGTWA